MQLPPKPARLTKIAMSVLFLVALTVEREVGRGEISKRGREKEEAPSPQSRLPGVVIGRFENSQFTTKHTTPTSTTEP